MPGRNPRYLIIGSALLLSWSPLALAAPAKPAAAQAAPKAKSKLDLPALQKALESGDEASLLAAIETIAQAGDPASAPLLEALLTRGASASVLGRSIETLGLLRQASSGGALVPYTQHRNSELRRAALRALIATKSPLAPEALRRALRGNDAALRSIAARGLGELGVRAAVPELFAVLPKDVSEAAQAIGLLCVADECDKFLGLLGKLRFEVMESGLVPVLLRPQAEVSDALKLKLVERLRRMATQPANQLIQTALARFPADGSPTVKEGLQKALKGHSVSAEAE